MMTTPDNLLFLHLLTDDIPNELLRHLCRDGGEADWRVVPWFVLLALFEDGSDTGFPAVLRHFSCSPGPFKDDGEWLSNAIFQLPQYLWVHPVRARGFVGVSFAKVISNLILPDQGKVFLSPGFLSGLHGLGFLRASLRSKE